MGMKLRERRGGMRMRDKGRITRNDNDEGQGLKVWQGCKWNAACDIGSGASYGNADCVQGLWVFTCGVEV